MAESTLPFAEAEALFDAYRALLDALVAAAREPTPALTAAVAALERHILPLVQRSFTQENWLRHLAAESYARKSGIPGLSLATWQDEVVRVFPDAYARRRREGFRVIAGGGEKAEA